MKFGQLFTAFGFAFFIFAGVIIAENMHYETLQKVQDPFIKTQKIDRIIETSSLETPQTIFTDSGEFIQVFSNTKLDFTNGDRKIIKGEVFLSSDFILDTGTSRKKQNTAKEGQIKVGNLFIHAPHASIFIIYTPNENIRIYAINHSIELYWADVKNPFLIPPGMMVSINEKQISKKTATLFYSKLKKEFRLKRFDLELYLSDITNLETPERKITHSVERLNKKEKELIEYADIAPETWFTIRPDNFTGRVVNFIKASTLGLPKSKKDLFTFQEMRVPLIKAHFSAKEGNKVNTQKSLTKFKQTINSHEWKSLLESNKEIRDEWNKFSQAQRVWINNNISNLEYVFTELYAQKSTSAFDKMDNEFNRFENLVASKNWNEAERVIKDLNISAETMILTEKHQKQLTKRRRILTELLNTRDVLEKKEGFELYISLIKKEITLPIEDKALQDELTLEIAQELLFFLNKYIKENPNKKISEVLISGYNNIKSTIEESTKRKGRASLFSEEEKEIQTLIKIAGSSIITDEELESIKKEQAYRTQINERIAQLKTNKNSLEKKPPIHNEETLKIFLEENEIDIEKLEIKNLKNNEYLNFTKGMYLDNEISGTFQIKEQVFKTIKVNDKSNHNVPQKFIKGILNSLIETKTNEHPVAYEKEKEIPQNTNKAILEKTFIRELFTAEGFTISSEYIEALNMELTEFKITNAIIEGQTTVSFIYDSTANKISEIIINTGNKKFRSGKKPYTIEEGVELIMTKTEEMNKK